MDWIVFTRSGQKIKSTARANALLNARCDSQFYLVDETSKRIWCMSKQASIETWRRFPSEPEK